MPCPAEHGSNSASAVQETSEFQLEDGAGPVLCKGCNDVDFIISDESGGLRFQGFPEINITGLHFKQGNLIP